MLWGALLFAAGTAVEAPRCTGIEQCKSGVPERDYAPEVSKAVSRFPEDGLYSFASLKFGPVKSCEVVCTRESYLVVVQFALDARYAEMAPFSGEADEVLLEAGGLSREEAEKLAKAAAGRTGRGRWNLDKAPTRKTLDEGISAESWSSVDPHCEVGVKFHAQAVSGVFHRCSAW